MASAIKLRSFKTPVLAYRKQHREERNMKPLFYLILVLSLLTTACSDDILTETDGYSEDTTDTDDTDQMYTSQYQTFQHQTSQLRRYQLPPL